MAVTCTTTVLGFYCFNVTDANSFPIGLPGADTALVWLHHATIRQPCGRMKGLRVRADESPLGCAID